MVATKGACGAGLNLGDIVDSQVLERNVMKEMTEIA